MQCANPHCRKAAENLDKGCLTFVEMEVPPEERTIRSDSGFPICSVPGKFFWLCAACSVTLKIRRWTRAGLVLEQIGDAKLSPAWSAPAKMPVRRAHPGHQQGELVPKTAYLGS